MRLFIQIRGPGMDEMFPLHENASPLVLGRDSSASVALQDPDRTVSRKHISISWAPQGALISVLSTVNGVTTSTGELMPGEQGTLEHGEYFEIGPYVVTISCTETDASDDPLGQFGSAAPPRAPARPVDAFDLLDSLGAPPVSASFSGAAPAREGQVPGLEKQPAHSINDFISGARPSGGISGGGLNGGGRVPVRESLAPVHVHPHQMPVTPQNLRGAAEDDDELPTGWGALQPDHGAAHEAPPSPSRAPTAPLTATELTAFCKGLGVAVPADADAATWQSAGAAVRCLLESIADMMAARSELKRELRAEERTMLVSHDNNPLKTHIPIEELLSCMLFGDAANGYMEPAEALAEAVTELRAHDLASVAASRAAIEGALAEFDPGRLRAAAGVKTPSFLGRARLWDAYVARYEQHNGQKADWLEQVFNRHFMPAYAREASRLLRVARPARREAR